MVDEVRKCYIVLNAVHALWPPIPGQFEDLIAQPRFGSYQSLHTAVLGPDGKPLEVQIRTHQMDRPIEYRTANTWPTDISADVLLTSMRRLFAPAGRRRCQLTSSMICSGYRDTELFACTPRGDMIMLPSAGCGTSTTGRDLCPTIVYDQSIDELAGIIAKRANEALLRH